MEKFLFGPKLKAETHMKQYTYQINSYECLCIEKSILNDDIEK